MANAVSDSARVDQRAWVIRFWIGFAFKRTLFITFFSFS